MKYSHSTKYEAKTRRNRRGWYILSGCRYLKILNRQPDRIKPAFGAGLYVCYTIRGHALQQWM